MLPSVASEFSLEMSGAFLANTSANLRTLYWVGGTNEGGQFKRDWRWLDGSPWHYTAWLGGEPNDPWAMELIPGGQPRPGTGSGIFGVKAGKWMDVPTAEGDFKIYKIATICQRGTCTKHYRATI